MRDGSGVKFQVPASLFLAAICAAWGYAVVRVDDPLLWSVISLVGMMAVALISSHVVRREVGRPNLCDLLAVGLVVVSSGGWGYAVARLVGNCPEAWVFTGLWGLALLVSVWLQRRIA